MEQVESSEQQPGEGNRPVLLFIFLIGVFLIVFSGGFFLYLADRWPEPYAHVYQLVVAHIGAGRAGNAAWGVKLGFPNWFILYQSCMVDFVLMFLFYPIFVLCYRRFHTVPLIGTTLTRIHESALEHRDRIKPYGVVGLLAFVLIPIWSTGPLVGVVVGFLIGLGPLLTFSTVIVADIISVAAYVWAYDRVNAYSSTLGWVLVLLIVLFFITGALYRRLRGKQHPKNEISPRTD